MGAGGRERPGRYRVGGRRRRAGATSGASSGAQRSGGGGPRTRAAALLVAPAPRQAARTRSGTGRPARASRCVPRPIRIACGGGGRPRARQQGGGSNGTKGENVRTRRARRNLPILWTARATCPPRRKATRAAGIRARPRRCASGRTALVTRGRAFWRSRWFSLGFSSLIFRRRTAGCTPGRRRRGRAKRRAEPNTFQICRVPSWTIFFTRSLILEEG